MAENQATVANCPDLFIVSLCTKTSKGNVRSLQLTYVANLVTTSLKFGLGVVFIQWEVNKGTLIFLRQYTDPGQ